MGILKEPSDFIAALKLPAGFSVCELGNQQVSGVTPYPAKQLYGWMGCGRYVSIDANGQGSLLWDLNLPVTELELGTFDLVTDFGTGEHIFDQAQVWRTLHELTRPGGYIAFDRPLQSYGKHGFYLTTRCLYEDIALANGYTVVRLEQAETPRGWLIRGVFQRLQTDEPFRVPHQGRYQASSRLEVPA